MIGYDFVGSVGSNPAPDNDPTPGETENHGMACAGIMAASHNDTGVVGVFGSCEVVPIKIFDDSGRGTAHTQPIVDAIYYAHSRGARVVSNSWGYRREEPITDIQAAIREIVNGAGGSSRSPQATYGMVFVFAAGNWSPIYNVLFPANMPEVIAVGATDKNDQRWYYSCTGSALDIMAPSGNAGLQGDQWTVDQLGFDGWNPQVTGSNPAETDDVDYTAMMGGTSGACPQVAGIVGLLMARGHDSINPYNPTPNILDILAGSAEDLGTTGWDTQFGHGRANAFRAMLSIIRGDLNNDGFLDAVDYNLMIQVLFYNAPTLFPGLADVNCDGTYDATDLNLLIVHLWHNYPPPDICYEHYDY
ncbi:MAG: S8 family serine peptidase [candidate division Zixibacteria bacterium]|nr:S8 family serine peptidase [candidate division Zixibacteria bacterium]